MREQVECLNGEQHTWKGLVHYVEGDGDRIYIECENCPSRGYIALETILQHKDDLLGTLGEHKPIESIRAVQKALVVQAKWASPDEEVS